MIDNQPSRRARPKREVCAPPGSGAGIRRAPLCARDVAVLYEASALRELP